MHLKFKKSKTSSIWTGWIVYDYVNGYDNVRKRFEFPAP